jgi:hypothetical protein
MGSSHIPAFRKLGNDGTVEIFCRICERFISRQPYRGFSTAICYWCATGIPRPLEEDPTPASVNLYNESESDRQGLAGFVFKAVGFLKKIATSKTTSEKVAGAKKRKPLFSKTKDEAEEKKDE